MLSREARDRLCVVLVGARNPQNIGAAARAMQDFGFSDLRVVNEFAPPFEAAQLEAKSAVGAGEVMRNARLFRSLEEALEDCQAAVGTTAVGDREPRLPVQRLQDFAPLLRQELAGAVQPKPTALLFGSEKTGLTNAQLSYCSALLTIPMNAPEGRHLSMNLGQSVAVCLYEISREGFEGSRSLQPKEEVLASIQDRERLLGLLEAVMMKSGYRRRFPANARTQVVRGLVGQMVKTREEAFTWMGLLRMVLRGTYDDQSS